MSALLSVPMALWLCALNLAVIAALPRVFFRPGRLNANWWLTAAPFMLAGGGLVHAAIAGVPTPPLLQAAALVLAATSVFLIDVTLGSHHAPVSLWHQDDDVPDDIVTSGAYRYVRHPFYSAFLIALLGCAAAAPGVVTLLALVAGTARLRATALREERRLLAGPHGDRYRAYMRRTGRFLPSSGQQQRTRLSTGARVQHVGLRSRRH